MCRANIRSLCLLVVLNFTALTYPQNYDYLIITPDLFVQNTLWYYDLIDLQTSKGFQPRLEVITENTTSAQLINLIKDFYENNPLQYVLLMGSAKNISLGSPDTSYLYEYTAHGYINYKADYEQGTFIPFNAVYSQNPWNPNGWVYVASDDPYVDKLTEHGEVYIGRVPVISVAEAENYVEKLKIYYSGLYTYSSFKKREILLNLDVTYSNGCTGELVQYLNNKLKNDYIPDSIYYTELNVSEHTEGCSPHFYCYDREKLFEETLNQGASVITLLATIGGPANLGGWYWESSAFNITNKYNGIPFLLALNCHQGEVNNPDYQSAMRKLLVYPEGGIIGAIAPTEGSEQHFNGYFLCMAHELIYSDEDINYGKIFKMMKHEFTNNPPWLEFFSNGLTFFGDPSLPPSVYTKIHPAAEENIAAGYKLLGNYPNPFNPGTNICYKLPVESSVTLRIYDITGLRMRSLNFAPQSAGYKSIWWDGKNENGTTVSGGVYLYSLEFRPVEGNNVSIEHGKMILVK